MKQYIYVVNSDICDEKCYRECENFDEALEYAKQCDSKCNPYIKEVELEQDLDTGMCSLTGNDEIVWRCPSTEKVQNPEALIDKSDICPNCKDDCEDELCINPVVAIDAIEEPTEKVVVAMEVKPEEVDEFYKTFKDYLDGFEAKSEENTFEQVYDALNESFDVVDKFEDDSDYDEEALDYDWGYDKAEQDSINTEAEKWAREHEDPFNEDFDFDIEDEVKARDDEYEDENGSGSPEVQVASNCVTDTAREVMASYQNANRWLDSVKESIYTKMNCPFFSSFVHELAHKMPKLFDAYGDILHTINMEIPYPETKEIARKPQTIQEAFDIIFGTLDAIKKALNDFIKCTDENYHGMSCAAEACLNTIEAEYPMLYRLQAKAKECGDDTVTFDKYVMQYVEHKDDLLEELNKAKINKNIDFKAMKEAMEENEDEAECTWCNDLFPKSEMIKDKDLGYLCDKCQRAIKSKEGNVLEEDNFEDTGMSEDDIRNLSQDELEDMGAFDNLNEDIKKTWACFFDDRYVGTVEATSEDEAYKEMEQTFPELNYGLYDGVYQVYPEDELDEALHGKKEIDEFFKLCKEIGLETLGDLQRFADDHKNRIMVNELLRKHGLTMSADAFFETLKDYRKEELPKDFEIKDEDDFEYDDPLHVMKNFLKAL